MAAPSDFLAAYPFDEGSGTSAADVSGTHGAFDLTDPGASWATGVFGDAVRLQNVGSVGAAFSPNIDLSSGYTVTFWFRTDQPAAHQELLRTGPADGPWNGLVFEPWGDNQMYLGHQDSNGTYRQVGAGNYTGDVWRFYAVTWNPETDTVQAWVGGPDTPVVSAGTTGGGGGPGVASEVCYIGGNPGQVSIKVVDGLLDELTFFGRVLSQSELDALRVEGIPTGEVGLPPPQVVVLTGPGSGTWQAPAGVEKLDHVIFWGGGGGGMWGGSSGPGGGGAGEVKHLTDMWVYDREISYTIGAGGRGAHQADSGTSYAACHGGSTIWDGIEALGGGVGAGHVATNPDATYKNGGSGGGASSADLPHGDAGVATGTGMGHDGGAGERNGSAPYGGGGGGGAGEPGHNADPSPSAGVGGDGGEGVDLSALTGLDLSHLFDGGWVAGGGGGGGTNAPGQGGRGGGGTAADSSPWAGSDALPDTGSGGGARRGTPVQNDPGGNGANGAILIVYTPLFELLPPANVIATAQSPTSILVEWDAVSGADAYDVERDSVIVAEKISQTQFLDEGLQAGTQYTYRVRSAAETT